MVRKEEKEECQKMFRNFLAARGLKITRERERILCQVMEKEGHFQVEELAIEMRAKKNPVSRATIYRTLELLTEAGILRKIIAEGGAQFELGYGKGYHGHLICLSCGRIIEFSLEELSKLEEKVVKKNRFLPKSRNLLIFGYCQTCQRKGR
ncbi:MAG: transcriptional repressor [Acidobacteria bacterium]|nr:transcriptional repressor [Acidobacteriota bacterium]